MNCGRVPRTCGDEPFDEGVYQIELTAFPAHAGMNRIGA